MSDINRDKQSRRAIIISILLLAAIAIVIIFIIRQRHHMKQEQQASANIQLPATPISSARTRIQQFDGFYTHFDTARMAQDPQLLAIAFRQLMPVLDELSGKVQLKPQSVGPLKDKIMRSVEEIANDPKANENSKKLKLVLTGTSNLMDSIVVRMNPGEVSQVEDLHKMAAQINVAKAPFTQKNIVGAYFRKLEQIVTNILPAEK